MIWQLRGLNPEAVDLWGDLTTFFKACMKTESLQKMVFSWMEKIFRETLTLEHFFCAFIYSIDCSIVLQKDDVLMLVGVRRDQIGGYWKAWSTDGARCTIRGGETPIIGEMLACSAVTYTKCCNSFRRCLLFQ